LFLQGLTAVLGFYSRLFVEWHLLNELAKNHDRPDYYLICLTFHANKVSGLRVGKTYPRPLPFELFSDMRTPPISSDQSRAPTTASARLVTRLRITEVIFLLS
jgi:hypothetical protein